MLLIEESFSSSETKNQIPNTKIRTYIGYLYKNLFYVSNEFFYVYQNICRQTTSQVLPKKSVEGQLRKVTETTE